VFIGIRKKKVEHEDRTFEEILVIVIHCRSPASRFFSRGVCYALGFAETYNQDCASSRLVGCGFFTQPEIVDVTDKTVRVRYVNTGSRDLETKAMQLIAKHCGQGGFRVTNRTVQATYRNVSGEPTQIAIDAVCL